MALHQVNPATSRVGYPSDSLFKNSAAMSTSSDGASFPSHFATEGCGGFVEVPDNESRNAIPVSPSGQSQGNIMTSGKRSVGMIVHVIDTGKLWKLIPEGFWGNNGSKDYNDWIALGGGLGTDLGDSLRASLLSPGTTYQWEDGNGSTNNNTPTKYYFNNGTEYKLEQACSLGTWATACIIQGAYPNISTLNLPTLDANSDDACWVELEFEGTGESDAYVNGVENKKGAFTSVHQTGTAHGGTVDGGTTAPAIWGDKTFVNSYLHIKHDSSLTTGAADQLSDPNLDAALQVDKRVTVGTAADEIFSVKDNKINLKTITNIKNIPHFAAGSTAPVAGVTSVTVNTASYLMNTGDLYTYEDASGHILIGITA
jgi:hypothetical protein